MVLAPVAAAGLGTLLVRGRDPRDDPEARRDVAFVPAEPELPDVLTVDEAWQEVAALRRRPSWDGRALRRHFELPGDLRLGQCSAGQRRMAELVVGAAGDPRVMLLDEPFANLDAGRSDRLVQRIADWSADRVIVVTSHRPLPLEPVLVLRLGPAAVG